MLLVSSASSAPMPRRIVVLEFNRAHAFGNPTERVIKMESHR
jgi:hypothetical protein